MKKIIVLVAIVLIASASWIFSKKYIGDVRPSFFPSKNISQLIQNSSDEPVDAQTGEPVDFPLKMPDGYQIGIFSDNTPGARDLTFSPNGTLLVSETGKGQVVALPDTNRDGKADDVVEVINNLTRPHGMLFDTAVDKTNNLYIAEETRLARYTWDENTKNIVLNKEIAKLPAGGRHFTRSLTMDSKGNIYVSLGSSCDTCFEKNPWLASVIVTDRDGNNPHVYSKGLRNAVFLATNPKTDEIWATEMGRDFLGDETPPDEIDILKDGADYGWPVCYADKIYDRNFDQQSPSYCDKTIPPTYKIAAHSAPLGLIFINSPQFPADWQGDLLVALHGSWNRSTPVGYKIVRLKVNGNTIVSESDFLSGFLQGSSALGRPVDMAFDKEGSLYVSDDKAGVIYKIVKK